MIGAFRDGMLIPIELCNLAVSRIFKHHRSSLELFSWCGNNCNAFTFTIDSSLDSYDEEYDYVTVWVNV